MSSAVDVREKPVPWDVRIALHQHYRALAWRRQRGRCLYCRRALALTEVTADRRVPQACGGRTVEANIDAACLDCNRLKRWFHYGQFMLAINQPDLRRDDWALHLAGVEVRVMRRATEALDRLRSITGRGR